MYQSLGLLIALDRVPEGNTAGAFTCLSVRPPFFWLLTSKKKKLFLVLLFLFPSPLSNEIIWWGRVWHINKYLHPFHFVNFFLLPFAHTCSNSFSPEKVLSQISNSISLLFCLCMRVNVERRTLSLAEFPRKQTGCFGSDGNSCNHPLPPRPHIQVVQSAAPMF